MTAIFILIGASLVVAAGFLFAYFWAVRSGQYDDTYTPSVRILFDDRPSDNDDNSLKHRSEGEKLNGA